MARISQNLGIIAVFTAFSFVLGLIKMPTFIPSIALDSSPGYFLAAYLSPWIGGVVGALGHLASAASGGFPLGYVHLVVSGQMFLWCVAFGLVARAINRHWGLVPASLLAIGLNGVVGPWMVGVVGLVPMVVAVGIMPLLSLAAGVNVAIASVAVVLLSRKQPVGESDGNPPTG